MSFSLTPDELMRFVNALMLASAAGAFFGAICGPLFELLVCLLSHGARALFGPKKSELERLKDLECQRRLFLIRARTAGRELRKLRLRQFIDSNPTR